jgi:hypothetical protein
MQFYNRQASELKEETEYIFEDALIWKNHTKEVELWHRGAKNRIHATGPESIIKLNVAGELEASFVENIEGDAVVLESYIDSVLFQLKKNKSLMDTIQTRIDKISKDLV